MYVFNSDFDCKITVQDHQSMFNKKKIQKSKELIHFNSLILCDLSGRSEVET